MYTMKDFREKKIAVRVGTKHVKEFLQMCEAEGMRWADGERATEFIPDESAYGCETVITMNATSAVGRLTYGSAPVHAKYEGMTIVDFEDFAKQPTPARYKITIECDGTTTTARMEINGKEVRQAQSKRNPADKFSWRVGAETAFGRLWGKGEKQEPADGVREVKRVAKVGEWVKIVNKFGYSRETYKNGDIRKVTGLYTARFADDGGWVYLDGESCATHSSEYVVLDGYKPGNAGKEERQEKKARPFKVGDRVVCVEEVCGNKNVVGKHGEIIGKHNVAGLLVEFDVKVDGHNGNGFIKNLRGKNRHCWYCFERALRHE